MKVFFWRAQQLLKEAKNGMRWGRLGEKALEGSIRKCLEKIGLWASWKIYIYSANCTRMAQRMERIQINRERFSTCLQCNISSIEA